MKRFIKAPFAHLAYEEFKVRRVGQLIFGIINSQVIGIIRKIVVGIGVDWMEVVGMGMEVNRVVEMMVVGEDRGTVSVGVGEEVLVDEMGS